MKLPNFLIIGAMKSGTTTLYRDLQAHPRVFMPHDKEPETLCDDHVLTPKGQAEYAALFDAASADQICGEASTAYTKLPDYPGVPERALKVLGPDLKLIYIVRHPIQRAISHHHHLHFHGVAGPDINQAVHTLDQLVDYSRYAMQLRPWIETFGRDQIKVLRFEQAMRERDATAHELWRFLGLDPIDAGVGDRPAANVSQGKPHATSLTRRVIDNPVYRGLIRPLIPPAARTWVIRTFLPKAHEQLPPPSRATLDAMAQRLASDAKEFGGMLGEAGPLWDLHAIEPCRPA